MSGTSKRSSPLKIRPRIASGASANSLRSSHTRSLMKRTPPELTLDHVYRAADELCLRINEDYLPASRCLPDDFEEEVWESIREDYASDHEVA